MKRTLIVLALALALGLAGCAATPQAQSGDGPADQTTPVVVFAAASLEASLTQIAQDYRAVAPDVELIFTFDSSGTLKTQIEEGAVCDLFLSAAQKQMDQLDIAHTAGTSEPLDFVRSETRIDLVENKVVLAVPDSNPRDIHSFQDLTGDKLGLLCLGNEDVPVGAYSLEILDYLGIDLATLEAEGKVTYASNVSEVARQVEEGAVDCGMIYATDACTYGLTVVAQAEPGMCSQVVYPAAVMKCGTPEGQKAAQDFLNYLHTDPQAAQVLESVGFTLVN